MAEATRFKFLDKQTNVPVSDFLKLNHTDILNTVENELKTVGATATDLINKTVQESGLLQKISEVKDSVDLTSVKDSVREGRELYGKFKDLAAFAKQGPKYLEKAVGNLLPLPAAQTAFNKLATSCKSNAVGRNNIGKPFDASINCGGRNKKAKPGGCNAGDYMNIMDKLTGNEYSAAYRDLNGTLNTIVNLANYGYSLNMCGAFNALTSSVADKNVIARAAGGLLGILGSAGNVNGFLDVAASSIVKGVNPLSELPGAIPGLLNNFKIPFDTKEADLATLMESSTEVFGDLDNSWATLDEVADGSIATLKGMDIYENEDLTNAFGALAVNSDPIDLFDNSFSDSQVLACAYVSNDNHSQSLMDVWSDSNESRGVTRSSTISSIADYASLDSSRNALFSTNQLSLSSGISFFSA